MKKFFIIMIAFLLVLTGVFASSIFQEVRANVVAGKIFIHSPIEGKIYEQRMIPINVSLTEEVSKFRFSKYLSDNGHGFITLCRNCNSYGYERLRLKPFDDGYHFVRIKAVFDGGVITENVSFIIDTRRPIIRRTRYKRDEENYVFYLEYQEENIDSIFFNYGNSRTGFRNIELNPEECYLFRRNWEMCNVSVDLKDYHGERIEYWFKIEDITGKTDESRMRRLRVDVYNFFKYLTGRVIDFFGF